MAAIVSSRSMAIGAEVTGPPPERTRRGTAVANQQNGRTRMERVWAGGDIVTGAATVISAMGAGRVAATDINSYLNQDGDWAPWWQEPEA